MIRIELLTAGDFRWDEWLSHVDHDVYHTRCYHRLAEAWGEGKAQLAICHQGNQLLLWPFLKRPIDGDMPLWDATSVYGYPGPLAAGCVPGDRFLADCWEALTDLWTSESIVSVFSRCNPLLGNVELFGRQPPGGVTVEPRGRIVYIDLKDRSLKKTLRQDIQRGRRAGLTAAIDEDWTHLDQFLDAYYATMDRNKADLGYYFSRDYIAALRRSLESFIHLMVIRHEDRFAGAMILLEHDGVLHAHLVGTDPAIVHLSPLKVLLDDTCQWASARGSHGINLGGGRGGREDSLFQFKSGFSNSYRPFHLIKWVVQPELYRDLVMQQSEKHGTPAGEKAMEAFFPQYRAAPSPAGHGTVREV